MFLIIASPKLFTTAVCSGGGTTNSLMQSHLSLTCFSYFSLFKLSFGLAPLNQAKFVCVSASPFAPMIFASGAKLRVKIFIVLMYDNAFVLSILRSQNQRN